MKQKPLVTVSCIAYNHEKYIARALDSFLKQKTDFPFEIVIHDDADYPRICREISGHYPAYVPDRKPVFEGDFEYQRGL